ncbi:MAG TPA: 50S ribosomal protein L31 [Candidatus Faecicola pullistercoris]|nr:50S ribosomal protein L31 [Candidatus Faecicola pullistercoris]
MKEKIHPDYHDATVVCACGATFTTGTTKKTDTIKVEICNQCHPYFTGKQKLVDTGGRVDKFKKRYNLD